MNKKYLILLVALQVFSMSAIAKAETATKPFEKNRYLIRRDFEMNDYAKNADYTLINWIKGNVSSETGLPFSFQIPLEEKEEVYGRMGGQNSVEGIIERVIVEEGLVIYDGAVRQIVLSMLGGEENLKEAFRPVEVYWNGSLNDISNLRAGFPINNFIYDINDPYAVSSDLSEKGKRGFIFRIINANGRYATVDPYDGKSEFEGFPAWPAIHWEDWKPVAGENAWIAMSALHLYHKKYFNSQTQEYSHPQESVELSLAKELARAAILLQAGNGGIRMAPIGTYMQGHQDGKGWYNLISTENNLSWYAAFRMLYQITNDSQYKEAMDKMDHYFQLAWNQSGQYFYQGMSFKKGEWSLEKKHFATDVQTWGIMVLGCQKIDQWFGEGASYRAWQAAKNFAGSLGENGSLLGVGFAEENDRVSAEWTAGAIFAARMIAEYYKYANFEWSMRSFVDAQQMREGIELLRKEAGVNKQAYSYSSKRGWIPFGWFSHEPSVLSLASTAWMVLLDAEFNPFDLPGMNQDKARWELAEVEITN
ncbi:MAG: hypothetical protein PHY73_08535 [Candidatus Omnitrophica bacterium]|nr:hypothetical protein [Candidatus Omnitrophota bacterium]